MTEERGNGTHKRVSQVIALAFVLLLTVGVNPASGQEQACGRRAALRVTVLDESGAIVLPGATVVVRWTDAERMPVRTSAGGTGSVVVCVPSDATQAVLWAEFGHDSSTQAAVTSLNPGEEREIRFRILSSVRPGRLLGRVVDRSTDRPVATAAVRLLGLTEVAESDRQGRFRLTGVPAGTHELEVRRIGYAPLRHAVEVTRGLTMEVEIGLVREPVGLEPLVVSTTRSRRLEIKGFYERKHWGELLGLGTYYTAEDIDRRRPIRISHMIADAAGIRTRGGVIYNVRMGGCPTNIYLDNIKIEGGSESIDSLVLPIEVAGLEVYKGPASLPAEFSGSDSRCGAIVIWTK